MSYKKLSKKFSIKLTAKKKKEAAEQQLADVHKRTQAEISVEIKFSLLAFGLRFLIEDYLNEEKFDPERTFGSFLKMYVELMEKSRKKFAEEISISIKLLSRLINGHLMPADYIAIRLELHSDNIIPATYWIRLAREQWLHEIANDKELRKKEQQFVYNKLTMKQSA